MCTANGAILAISMSRSATWAVSGVCTCRANPTRCCGPTRIAMVPMTLVSILIAIYVKQT